MNMPAHDPYQLAPNAGYLPLPPGFGRRIRGSATAMGLGLVIAGVVMTALAIGLGALLRALNDSLWAANGAISVVCSLLVIGVAAGVLGARRPVSGDSLDERLARRARGTLRGWWLALLVVAVIGVVVEVAELVTALGGSSAGGNVSALDGAAVLIPIVAVGVGTIGFLIGRNLLPPPAKVLAQGWAAAGR
jgi:hypothetical protein